MVINTCMLPNLVVRIIIQYMNKNYYNNTLVYERVKAVIKNYSVKHEFSCSALKLNEC